MIQNQSKSISRKDTSPIHRCDSSNQL